MSASTDTAPQTVPTREGIEAEYQWNLADLYADDRAWESAFAEAEALVKTAGDFSGKLGGSPDVLYRCLEARSDLANRVGRLYVYAHLSKDLDNRVAKYQAMVERVAMLSAQAGAAFSFVEPELLAIDDARLLGMADRFPRTDFYDFYLKEVIRSRKHIRSAEVEETLAQSTVMARGAASVFSMLNDADMVYPVIKDEEGRDVQLSKQRFAKFMESKDRRVRRDAYQGFYKVYQEHLNTLGASLTASINKDVFYSRSRKYESCLHQALDSDAIPLAVYHALIETTESNLTALHRYVQVRKRLLKLGDVYAWDMMCPLFPDRDYEVSYSEAVDEILAAVRPLGDRYRSLLAEGLSSRWVDVFETQGKTSGAYSTGVYGVHPYVLMNYNGTIDNMFTLAHEMGHALHSYLTNETQPYPKTHYSIFVAEVASTLNEGLLLHHLLQKAADRGDRLFLLNRSIDNILGTFFYQTLLAHFELLIHEEMERSRALSPERLNQLYGDLVVKYHGPDFTPEEYSHIKWSRIPHFYGMYYVYQYATSFAASQMILDMIIQRQEGIVDSYIRLLSAGGRDHPIELLRICGVDMTDPSPVQAAVARFAQQVDEMDSLAG